MALHSMYRLLLTSSVGEWIHECTGARMQMGAVQSFRLADQQAQWLLRMQGDSYKKGAQW